MDYNYAEWLNQLRTPVESIVDQLAAVREEIAIEKEKMAPQHEAIMTKNVCEGNQLLVLSRLLC